MPKKTRKKPPKPVSRKAIRAPSVNMLQTKTRPTIVAKSSKNTAKRAKSATSETSHNTPSGVARKSALIEGAKAPAFRLPSDCGSTLALSDFAGKKLVLFFYPRANTTGCTREAIDFTRLAKTFAECQTALLGVSADPPKVQEAFRKKHQLSTPLVSDEGHAMLEAYGVWGKKSMYGKIFHGILRTTVLIGADGRILNIWHKVKVDGHAENVLATVRGL